MKLWKCFLLLAVAAKRNRSRKTDSAPSESPRAAPAGSGARFAGQRTRVNQSGASGAPELLAEVQELCRRSTPDLSAALAWRVCRLQKSKKSHRRQAPICSFGKTRCTQSGGLFTGQEAWADTIWSTDRLQKENYHRRNVLKAGKLRKKSCRRFQERRLKETLKQGGGAN